MRRVANRLFAGTLLALAAMQCVAAAAEPPPALELASTATSLAPGATSVVQVVRRDDAVGKAVSLRAPEGAGLWLADADGACHKPSELKATLDLGAGSPNPSLVCFSMKTVTTGARVLATVASGSSLHTAAQSFDIAEPPSESFWEKPGVSEILSALVGFLLGIGSSWLQVLFDTWKDSRTARNAAQKFIAESLFPEMREHATALGKYLAADLAELQQLCVRILKVPEITEALKEERLTALTSYFVSVSKHTLKTELKDYDDNLSAFNRWADRLSKEAANARDPTEQKRVAEKLYQSLKSWKIA